MNPASPSATQLNVLQVITLSEHGGAQTHVLTLLAAARSRAKVALVTSGEGWLTQAARDLGVEVHLVPGLVQPISPLQDLRAAVALYRLFRRLRPDLVHLHSSKAGLLGRVAARLAGVPAVFTAHGWAFADGVPANRKRLALFLERLAAPLAARIITVSDCDAALANRHRVGRKEQIRSIHNGIPDRHERALPRAEGPCRVVMTARFSAQNDHATLLRAAARVPDVHLTLIGNGELMPAAEALAAALGIGERITFLGARSDVPELLQHADVFALISHYEGFPISILEAMRAGLPVVASDVGGVREAVETGVNGVLVAREDEDALVTALQSLASDEPRRQAMGTASRQRFVARFTEEAMFREIWNVYQNVAPSRWSNRPRNAGNGS